MCKFAAVVLSGVGAFFFAWLCVFFIAGNVDVLTWKAENRFVSLFFCFMASAGSVGFVAVHYKNK